MKKRKLYKSVLEEVKEICDKYEMLSPASGNFLNEDIRDHIKRAHRQKLWRESLTAKFNIKRETWTSGFKPYHNFDKWRGKAILLWRVGMLKFARYQKTYNEKIKKSIYCPHPLCGLEDTYQHAVSCLFTDARLKMAGDQKWEDYRVLEFLISLNAERLWKYRLPIL